MTRNDSSVLLRIQDLKKHYPVRGSFPGGRQGLVKADQKTMLKARRDIQMIFQDPYASLDPRMTVRSIIAEPLVI